jgi:hypothetical protein
MGGPRAGLDDVEEKILTLPGLERRPLVVQPELLGENLIQWDFVHH